MLVGVKVIAPVLLVDAPVLVLPMLLLEAPVVALDALSVLPTVAPPAFNAPVVYVPPVAVLVPPVDVVVPPVLVVFPPVILVFTVLSLLKSLPFDAVTGLIWLTALSLLDASPMLTQLGAVPQSVVVVVSAKVEVAARESAKAIMVFFMIIPFKIIKIKLIPLLRVGC